MVFLENLLGFYVLFRFIENLNNWPIVLAYSLGASLGTFVNMRTDLEKMIAR